MLKSPRTFHCKLKYYLILALKREITAPFPVGGQDKGMKYQW